jgi:hypothetical protein
MRRSTDLISDPDASSRVLAGILASALKVPAPDEEQQRRRALS